MKRVLFVSHCILNTASKVVLYNKEEMEAEEALRRKFLSAALTKGIQIIQLPCPEFTLYGAKRWGHVKDQFDNPFFKEHCRNILAPMITQLKEYLANDDFFEVVGIVGIDGSPSCGVDYSCRGSWYGSFESRTNLQEALSTARLSPERGAFMEVLVTLLKEEGLFEKVKLTSLYAPEPEKCMGLL